ncbi:hypothetical protein BJV78DRAFT_1157319 [Lactifluus subvellereus]|nr:hypothetical protein BJV78DRAFT_1157319 [Lactifluus subvellereus]
MEPTASRRRVFVAFVRLPQTELSHYSTWRDIREPNLGTLQCLGRSRWGSRVIEKFLTSIVLESHVPVGYSQSQLLDVYCHFWTGRRKTMKFSCRVGAETSRGFTNRSEGTHHKSWIADGYTRASLMPRHSGKNVSQGDVTLQQEVSKMKAKRNTGNGTVVFGQDRLLAGVTQDNHMCVLANVRSIVIETNIRNAKCRFCTRDKRALFRRVIERPYYKRIQAVQATTRTNVMLCEQLNGLVTLRDSRLGSDILIRSNIPLIYYKTKYTSVSEGVTEACGLPGFGDSRYCVVFIVSYTLNSYHQHKDLSLRDDGILGASHPSVPGQGSCDDN